jgi:lysyl-tRNA synthetase class 2
MESAGSSVRLWPDLRRQRAAKLVAPWLRAGAALMVAGPGALTLVDALTPYRPLGGRLALNPPTGSAVSFTHLLAAAAGGGLVALAPGLLRGWRAAAAAATAAAFAVVLFRLIDGRVDADTAAILVLALLLVAGRGAFNLGPRPRPSLRTGGLALASIAAAYGLCTVLPVASDRFSSLGAALAADASGRPWHGSLILDSPLGVTLDALALLGLAAGAVFLRALLRPVSASDGHTEREHAAAAALVAERGTDSLDPFALREDKAFHFAAGGFLAYRTLRETAVVSGDPIGPPGSAPQVLASFRSLAAGRGWDVVVTAASQHHLEGYARMGMRALHIGNEAVVDPRAFTLEGRAIRKVRQSVHRVRRRGWRVDVLDDRDLAATTVAEIEALERAWRASRPRLQGFAMTLGRLWPADDLSGMYVTARDPDGRLRAFLRFVHYARGLSLDAMRRLGDEPNGLNEAMVVAALSAARELGLEEVSLNFAGFAHVMAADAALNGRQRLLRAILQRVHGRFQLERLVRFNEKFAPEWRPRYLIYGRRTHLPLAALRVLQTEAYLRPPRTRPLTARWSAPTAPIRVTAAATGR